MSEYEYAVYEANLIHAMDVYFEARPQLFNTIDKRKLFEAGFERGYKIQREKITELEQQAEKYRDDIASWQRVHRSEYEKREALDQQLKTASRYFTFGESFIDAIKNHIVIEESGVVHLDDMVIDNPSCCRMFEDGAILFIAEQHSIKLNEYANDLEGK